MEPLGGRPCFFFFFFIALPLLLLSSRSECTPPPFLLSNTKGTTSQSPFSDVLPSLISFSLGLNVWKYLASIFSPWNNNKGWSSATFPSSSTAGSPFPRHRRYASPPPSFFFYERIQRVDSPLFPPKLRCPAFHPREEFFLCGRGARLFFPFIAPPSLPVLGEWSVRALLWLHCVPFRSTTIPPPHSQPSGQLLESSLSPWPRIIDPKDLLPAVRHAFPLPWFPTPPKQPGEHFPWSLRARNERPRKDHFPSRKEREDCESWWGVLQRLRI